jgi:glutaredoxin-like protein
MIQDEDAREVREQLQGMTGPVTLVHFTEVEGLEFGAETLSLLRELTVLSPLLSLEVYTLSADHEKAREYGIDKAPATVIRNSKDYGIRFYGFPAGLEFSTLLDAILAVSMGNSGLLPGTREKLAIIGEPVHIEVFVTPTCGYCPRAVRTAYRFAMESEWVRADAIEATEFPELASRNMVQAVPKTIVNGRHAVEGMFPEEYLAEELLKALDRHQDGERP